MNILFISGWGFSPNCMKLIGDNLPNATCDYIGVSEALGPNLGPRINAFDEAPIVVAWSTGAFIALDYHIKNPGALQGLGIISGGLSFVKSPVNPSGTHPKILKRMITAMDQFPDKVLQDFCIKAAKPFDTQTQFLDPAQATKLALEYLSSINITSAPLALSGFTIHGSNDQIIPASAQQALKELLPSMDHHIVKNGGHALPITHAQEVASHITKLGFATKI